MPSVLPLGDFLKAPGALLDVRSPSEFLQGHLPNSYSFPLFDDEERARIGRLYHGEGKEAAISLGLSISQSKLPALLTEGEPLIREGGRFLCWRGGMRSGSVAHLFAALGYRSSVLEGGYKSYRRWVLMQLASLGTEAYPFPSLFVIGGLTGTGKTEVLHALRQHGEQIIDLESIAHHRGSVFGAIDSSPQPTQEQFENELMHHIDSLDRERPVWVEDESRLIGTCRIPHILYEMMQKAPLFYLQCPTENRLCRLVAEYGTLPHTSLLSAIQSIARRLGRQRADEVRHAIEQQCYHRAAELLLFYYDATYRYHLQGRNAIHVVEGDSHSPETWANLLLSLSCTGSLI